MHLKETELNISHKLNQYELSTWIIHLEHIKREIHSLQKMCDFNIDEEIDSTQFIEPLDHFENHLDYLKEELSSYKDQKPNALLCEDSQCDVNLIEGHEKQRSNYINFLKNYRQLKNRIYVELSGKKHKVKDSIIPYN